MYPEGRDPGLAAVRPRPALGSLITTTLDHLFAYGTLMAGFVRRPLLGPDAVLVGPARIPGSLYDFGEYPGLVLDGAYPEGQFMDQVLRAVNGDGGGDA